MSEQDMVEIKGWLFPADLNIPEQNWYRMEFGDSVAWDLDREGHEYLARQYGMVSLESHVATTGESGEIVYAAAESTLTIETPDGTETYTAVQGADTASQQVREPDYVWGVAESRAVKRAVKRALGIRSADESREPDTAPAGDPEPASPPDDFDPDPGHPMADRADDVDDSDGGDVDW